MHTVHVWISTRQPREGGTVPTDDEADEILRVAGDQRNIVFFPT